MDGFSKDYTSKKEDPQDNCCEAYFSKNSLRIGYININFDSFAGYLFMLCKLRTVKSSNNSN